MAKQRQRTESPDKKATDKGRPDLPCEGDDGVKVCRCEEVAKKTPRELLKMMLSDLTFRKKK